MNEALDVKTSQKESLPTVFGYIGISVAFGMIVKAAGLSVWLIVLISAIDYVGAAQFVLVTMLAANSALGAIILSVFFSEFKNDSDEYDVSTIF